MAVYVVSQPGGSLVKIGHAEDLRAHFRGLVAQSPVPLVLRAHWSGDIAVERGLHRHFADRRRHAEWFEFGDQDPVALIAAVLDRQPEPPPDLSVTRCPARPTAPPRPSVPSTSRIPDWMWGDALPGPLEGG